MAVGDRRVNWKTDSAGDHDHTRQYERYLRTSANHESAPEPSVVRARSHPLRRRDVLDVLTIRDPMIDQQLRFVKERALAPVVPHLRGVTPMALSMAGLAVGLAAAAAAATGAFAWALGLWLLNRLLDGLDGEVARAHGRSSDFGGYIDLVSDFVVYAAVPLGIAVRVDAYAPVAILLAAYYVNAASCMLLSQLLERRASARTDRGRTTLTIPTGVVEGAETVVGYVILLLFPLHFQLFALVLAFMVVVTAAQRVVWAYRTLPKPADAASGIHAMSDSTSTGFEEAA